LRDFEFRPQRSERHIDRKQTEIQAEIDAAVDPALETRVRQFDANPAIQGKRAHADVEIDLATEFELAVRANIAAYINIDDIKEIQLQLLDFDREHAVLDADRKIALHLETEHLHRGADVDLEG